MYEMENEAVPLGRRAQQPWEHDSFHDLMAFSCGPLDAPMSPLKPEPHMDQFLGSMFDEFFPGLDDWAHHTNKHPHGTHLNNGPEEPSKAPTTTKLDKEDDPVKQTCSAPDLPVAVSDIMPTADNSRRAASGEHVSELPKASVLPADKGTSAVQSQLSVRSTRKEVIRLEKEISEKLTLLSELEQKNRQLKRKEKLLKITVSNGERSVKHVDGSDFSTHVAELLLSFKSQVSKMEAERLMQRKFNTFKDPATFTLEDFRIAFKSFTDEVSALYLEYLTERASDPTPSSAPPSPSSTAEASSGGGSVANDERWGALYAASSAKVQGFLMAVSVNCPLLVDEIRGINLQTGERCHAPEGHWAKVVDRLSLSPDQLGDMAAACELTKDCLDRVFKERAALVGELQGLATAQAFSAHTEAAHYGAHMAMDNWMPRMQANLKRGSLFQTMETFLCLALLTPGQRGVMVLEAWPFYLDVHAMLGVAREQYMAVQEAEAAEKLAALAPPSPPPQQASAKSSGKSSGGSRTKRRSK